MKRITKVRVAVGAIVCGVCFAIVYSTCSLNNQAYATSSTNYNSTVVKKALLQGVHRCYTNGAIKSKVDKISTFTSFTSLVIGGTSGTYIALPSGLTNITDNNISCSGLFFGDATGIGTEGGTFEGLFRLAGRSASATTKEAKQTLLEGMGYNQDNNSSAVLNQKCIAFNYKQKQQYISQPSTVTTDQICAQIGSDGKITSLSVNMSTATYGVKSEVSFFKVTNDGKISVPIAPVITEYGYTGYTDQKETITSLGVGSTWSDFSTDLRSTLSKRGAFTYKQEFYDGSSVTYDYSFEGNSTAGNYDEDTVGDVSYSFNNARLASTRAIRYLSNSSISDWQSLGFSDAEKIALLSMSLKEYFYAGVSDVSSYWVCNVSDWADYGSFPSSHAIKVSPNGSLSANCRINPSLVKNSGTIYGFSGNFFDSAGGTKLNLAATIAEINRLAGDVPDDVDQVPIDPGVSGGTTGGENGGNNGGSNGGSTPDADVSSLTACYESAGVLGWIACPVLEAMGGVVEKLYGFIERNFLQVDSGLVNDPGTRSGWTQFRDFSNTLFAIMFVIIILSQVTGLGLSNYNVKKILPRLIMVVVLVNISFILCQLAVDISNLVGFSLNGMFEGFASTAADTKGGVPFDLGTVAGGILGSALGVGGTVVVLGVLAVTIPWELWLFPMILAIIACVISILFFFILLGVRQAGIIILITLAPLAIVCYALPNTKSLFDKWFKLFTALLLVYPICGVLMGGGKFASTLLLITSYNTDAGAFFTIVAMLLAVVPFFLVPSVLRSSMVAMGNLGAKIATFGSRVGGSLTRGIRNSELGRDIQRQQQMRYADRAAQRLERRSERTGGLSPRNQRRLNRYNSRYNRMAYEDIRAGGVDQRLTPGSSQREAAEQAARSRQENEDISGRQDLYRGGSMASIIAGHTDPVNGNNNDELEDELSAYMDRIITGEAADGTRLTDDEVNDSVMNAQALINTLSDQGTSGARAKVEQSFARAMNRHQAIFGDATQRGRLTNTFGSLASRTSAKYGKDYKKDSPGTAAMLGDIAQGNFSRAGSFIASGRTDSRGNSVLRSTHYSGAGVSGMNTEDFSKLKAYGANNILDGIRAGQITGSDARAASRMADEVLNSGVYSPDADVRDVLEQIRTAGYSAGGAINGRSAGSLALSGASTGALESMVSDISGIADSAAWGSLSAAEQSNYRQLFDNIRETLDNDTLSAANADQLQQALKIAHDRGFTDASGNVIGTFSGTPHLKIDHSAPQPIVVPPVPQGWTEGGMWTGGGSGPSKQQEIAYQEWAKIKARADMQNNGGNP